MPEPPRIEAESCTGCELCVRACPSFVLAMRGPAAVVERGGQCIGCGHCVAVCPVEAVSRPEGAPPPMPAAGAPPVRAELVERLLRERRSVRLYRDEPLPRDLLERIVEGGRYAPTGTNSRNVRFIVVSSADELERLRQKVIAFYERLFRRVKSAFGAWVLSLVAGRKVVDMLRGYLPVVEHAFELCSRGEDPLLHGAPALVLVHAEALDPCSAFNGAVALYSASLVAHALGAGCCFNGFVEGAVNNDRGLKAFLGIPREQRCFGAMTVGYPAVKYLRPVFRNPLEVAWR